MLRQLELEPDTPIAEIVPDDFRALIARRLDRVDPEVRRILGVGAVLGRVFSLEIAATIAAMSVDDALDHLDVAIAQGFVVEGDAVDDYAFAHPLVRNAVYYLQVKGRRARTARAVRRGCSASNVGRAVRRAGARSPATSSRRSRSRTRTTRPRWPGGPATMRWPGSRTARRPSGTAPHWRAPTGRSPSGAVARMRLAYGVALDRSGRVDESHRELLAVTGVADELGDVGLKRDAVIALTPIESVLDTGSGTAWPSSRTRPWSSSRPTIRPASSCSARCASPGSTSTPTRCVRLAAEAERIARSSTDRIVNYSAQTVRYIAAATVDDEDRLAITRDTLEYCRAHGLVVEEGMATKRLLSELLIVGDFAEFDAEIGPVRRARAGDVDPGRGVLGRRARGDPRHSWSTPPWRPRSSSGARHGSAAGSRTPSRTDSSSSSSSRSATSRAGPAR